MQGGYELFHVAEMEAGSRFVEDVQVAGVLWVCNAGRQTDALCFAARKCGGWLAQRKIPQADVHQRLQLFVDHGAVIEEVHGFRYGHTEELVHVLAFVANLQYSGLVAGSIAFLAGQSTDRPGIASPR